MLDFAGNVARHGPIDARTAEGAAATARARRPSRPARTADSILPAAVRECPDCGHLFPPPRDQDRSAPPPTLAILSSHVGRSGSRSPTSRYGRHEKPGKPPSLARRLPLRPRRAIANGSASSTPATPARRRPPGGAARMPGAPVPATVDEALAMSDTLRATRARIRGAPAAAASPRSSTTRFDPCDLRRLPPRGARLRLVRRPLPVDSDPDADQADRQLCSRRCQDLCHRRRGMIDPTPNETRRHARTAGAMAGEYLDSLGKTDLARAQPRRVADPHRGHRHRLLRPPARARGQDRERLDSMIERAPL